MNRHDRRHLSRQGADIREAICLATKRPEKKEIQDAKDNFDNSRFGVAGCVDHPDRRGRGAPQGPKGGTRTGTGK